MFCLFSDSPSNYKNDTLTFALILSPDLVPTVQLPQLHAVPGECTAGLTGRSRLLMPKLTHVPLLCLFLACKLCLYFTCYFL